MEHRNKVNQVNQVNQVNKTMNVNGVTEITETLNFGMLLALVGGIMDVYSFIVRGNVFATGQTGNFVLAAVRLAEQDYTGLLHAVTPIAAFWAGIFTARHLFYSYFQQKHLLWKRWVLAASAAALFASGLIPCNYHNLMANTLVSFAAALQYCAFRKFGETENYASVFCTGNMRSCAENFYKGIAKKDKQSLKKALSYSYILISFFVGAIGGALSVNFLHGRTIWLAAAVLLAALALSLAPAGILSKQKLSA